MMSIAVGIEDLPGSAVGRSIAREPPLTRPLLDRASKLTLHRFTLDHQRASKLLDDIECVALKRRPRAAFASQPVGPHDNCQPKSYDPPSRRDDRDS